MTPELKQSFLSLVRLGIGRNSSYPEIEDWQSIYSFADEQGLAAIVVDGIEHLPEAHQPSKEVRLQRIGVALWEESRYAKQQKAATEMAELFHDNCIRTYVLKGVVVAECYPRPEHRFSSDLDCFLVPSKGDFNAWSLGNDLMKKKDVKVDTGFYKNSTFHLPGLTVENHLFLTPFRGNKKLRDLERMLQSMMFQDKGEDRFGETWLHRPPVMVSALFLIEHAYSHFLHEGLTWRHVLDWIMFSRKHKKDIAWNDFEILVEEFGFKRFYDSYVRLGHYLLGNIAEDELSGVDRKMLADVWAPLDLHKTLHGVKGKLGLVGNTLRAHWKYRYFGDISMLHALWIQVYGFLFEKNPRLD